MQQPRITLIVDWMLLRRTETLLKALNAEDNDKFDKVVNNTIATINARTATHVHEDNLKAYVKNLEFAQLLCCLGVTCVSKQHVELAADVIRRDLATMTPSYIMINRLSRKDTSDKDLGSLSQLPYDITNLISTMIV
jgi:hypothetical protein